jgi:hypothetical protein
MPLGTSIVLIAVGAVLRYAVTFEVIGIDIQVVGTILLIIGIIGLIISLILMFANRDGGGSVRQVERYPQEGYSRDPYQRDRYR